MENAFVVWDAASASVAAGPFPDKSQAEAARTSVWGKRVRSAENVEPKLAVVEVPA
jgi:hypothetical protein